MIVKDKYHYVSRLYNLFYIKLEKNYGHVTK